MSVDRFHYRSYDASILWYDGTSRQNISRHGPVLSTSQVHIIPIVGVGKIYQRCTLKVAAAKVGALVSADVS